MPVDTSKVPHVSRRQFRKVSTEEEIEFKRARGEISCAECRRLKLKCDKKLPCGSCVRRGCPSICPNGSLSTGTGARPSFVLADTEHLHRKIGEMGHRIRSLEDALAIFQAGASEDVHPLLTDELLAIKYGLEAAPRETLLDQQSVPISGLGTLTITERGDSNYYGRTAGSEVKHLSPNKDSRTDDAPNLQTLFLAGAELSGKDPECSSPDDSLPPVSSEISRLVSMAPFNHAGISDESRRNEIMDTLLNILPEYPRATTLCETYLENSAWMFRPISREELIDDVLAPAYAAAQQRKTEASEVKKEISPHALAVLYCVFALGALTDLTLPPYNSEAENFFHLARLALSLQLVYDLPTIQTLQALCLMSFYYANHGRHPTLDCAWSVMSMANKLAQSMGLHRDPARFNMSPKAIQRRRSLFWELLTADMFHSLTLGRPPSISLSYVDCEFPEDDTECINSKGEIDMGFFHWKYSFTKDVFIPVLETTLTVTPPTYEAILELDRKVREKVLPPSLNLYRSSSIDEYTTPTAYVRGRILFQFRTTTMLYIHRSFFAQAVLDFPANPLRSPFAPSFLAAYRCASGIIKTTAMNLQKHGELFARFWTVWNHLLSATIIVGSIVTRAPSSTMAPAAQLELDLALSLFRNGAIMSPRAKSGLAVLMHLKVKADQARGQIPVNQTASAAPGPGTLLPETGVDELAVFGGQTQVLVSKILSKQAKQARRNLRNTSPSLPTSSASSPAVSEDSHTYSDPVPEVHPSLVEYLTMLPPPELSSPSATHPASFSSQYQFGPKPSFQLDMFSNASLLPDMTSPSPLSSQQAQQVYSSTPLPPVFEEQFSRNFADTNFFGPSSAEAMDNSFNNLGLFVPGESGMDERWATLMQEMLDQPIS